MEIETVRLIYFSPTGTTRRVLQGIAQGLAATVGAPVDLTPPAAETQDIPALGDGLALIGAPVYAGRIPPVAARRLRRVQGRDTPAVVVVVYGNRAYEDALLELRDLVVAQGFVPVAGAAFIGEHSYSTAAMPIAAGRPDAADLALAAAFGQRVRERLAAVKALAELPPLEVPGKRPYRQWRWGTPIPPASDAARCTLCGTCATVCPTGAITLAGRVQTNAAECILCCACVKSCPSGAMALENEWVRQGRPWFFIRREPETY